MILCPIFDFLSCSQKAASSSAFHQQDEKNLLTRLTKPPLRSTLQSRMHIHSLCTGCVAPFVRLIRHEAQPYSNPSVETRRLSSLVQSQASQSLPAVQSRSIHSRNVSDQNVETPPPLGIILTPSFDNPNPVTHLVRKPQPAPSARQPLPQLLTALSRQPAGVRLPSRHASQRS